MKDHPTDDELVRLCLAQDEDPAATEARTHLAAGCSACGERVRELRIVLSSLSAPALREVPDSMLRGALAWISAQELATARPPASTQPAGTELASSSTAERSSRRPTSPLLDRLAGAATRILEELHAALVLDSAPGAVLQGIRGTDAANARQLLFESPAGSILLLVEPAGTGLAKMLGQFLPADGSAPAAGTGAVIEMDGQETRASVSPAGEFRFDAVPPGMFRLSLESGTVRIVSDPVAGWIE